MGTRAYKVTIWTESLFLNNNFTKTKLLCKILEAKLEVFFFFFHLDFFMLHTVLLIVLFYRFPIFSPVSNLGIVVKLIASLKLGKIPYLC